ncbi:flavin reductase family protein [Paenarthrobacter nicotinovorans]|uniref:flavin reductase family protein n=1 Tax=Paenarthrobacter nicotinovorans TaxID=29320 RepID=UPI003A80975B
MIQTSSRGELDLNPSVGSQDLRSAFSLFPSGVVAVAANVDGELVVIIASSFQVGISLSPPLVMCAIQGSSARWPRLRGRDRLGVSVLAESQGPTAMQLAARPGDGTPNVKTTITPLGAAFIHGAPLWLDCSIHNVVAAGDHNIVIFEVHSVGCAPEVEPLIWHRSGFRSLTPRRIEI